MKLRITCPGCRKGYVLDESAAGTEFVCPVCRTRCRIGTPAAAKVAIPAAATPPDPPAAVEAPADPPAARAEAPTTPEMVVCPRCKLHFRLRAQSIVAADGDRPRVLIVEEEGYFRQTATDALDTHCEIETAANVNEAESILAGGGIDLLVLDIMLDGGLGKRLLRTGAMKPCPILIYTSNDVSEMYGQEWDQLERLGADDIVFQGMNVAETLSRKAAALLGGAWGEDDADAE